MTKIRLYIDCQFFQTGAWDRGMGRYTMSLLSAIYNQAQHIEFDLIFSTKLTRNEAALKAAKKEFPKANIVELDLESTEKKSFDAAAAHNLPILQQYIDGQIIPAETRKVFLIPCLFQEPTASVFPEGVEKTLLYYDAIPLLYYERYKKAIKYDNYLERHRVLYEAHKIFSISETIADDLAVYYGMKSGDHVINIDGACIEGMFDTFAKPKIDLPEKYILFPTSNDIRKNNHAAVQAFEQFRTLTKENYKMVITSSFSDEQRAQLKREAKNLVFTGNISDHELAWLYKNADVVLFTSEYEGLGLPVLEAVRMGKKVACSNIPVFREISEEAFYFFDPLNVEDITVGLYQAVRGDEWQKKLSLYDEINKRYTWERSAGIVCDTLTDMAHAKPARAKKPKIAILTPAPDGYSAIGKVVQELHAETSKHFDVHYYFENRKEKEPLHVRPNYLEYLAPCFDVEEFNAVRYAEYDAVFYHIGNSEYHFYTILNALHLPGICIFHDTILREAFGEMVRQGFVMPSRLEAEARLDAMVGSDKAAFLTSLINNQKAAIVHSDYAVNALTPLIMQQTELVRGELPVAQPAQNVQEQRRDVVHIGLAGILGGRKGLDIIKELALDKTLAEDTVIHVFGFSFVDPESVEELKQYQNVRLMTNLSDLEYQMKLANLDILVNYRSSYRGETSLTVLEAMRYGCVTIVSKLGWFSELPDDSVVKVENEVELIAEVRALVTDTKRRHTIGNAAKNYTQTRHDPSAYISQMYALATEPANTINQLRSEAVKQSKSAKQALERYNDIEKEAK